MNLLTPVIQTPGVLPTGYFPTQPVVSLPNKIITETIPVIAPISTVLTTTPIVNTGLVSTLYPRSITVPRYLDLNDDGNLRTRVVKHFYNKLMDHWLDSGSMGSLLKFLKVKSDRVYFVESVKELEANKADDTNHTKYLKIQYIKDNLVSVSMIAHYIKRFTEKYNVNWYSLYNIEHDVKDYIKQKLKKKFMATVESAH